MIGRRDFITLLGGAAAWPLAARAQQPAVPIIGFLSSGSPRAFASVVAAYHQGMGELGYSHSRWGVRYAQVLRGNNLKTLVQVSHRLVVL